MDDEECLRDDWTRVCISLPLELVQISACVFCTIVAINACLLLTYAICLCYTRRPFYRALSFALVTGGLCLALPQAVARLHDPRFLPSTSIPHLVVFAIGDILDHVGILMVIYWDICTEAVNLVYALDPKQHSYSLKLCKISGMVAMASQLFVIGPMMILMHLMDSSSSMARCDAFSVFAFVQVGCIFGCCPTFAFGMLVRGVHRFWIQLPGEVPRRLVHRLRYTQVGLGILLLLCASFVASAALLGTLVVFKEKAGFMYAFVILTCLAFATAILLAGELILTMKLIRSKANRAIPLEPEVLADLVKVGVSQLSMQHMQKTQSVAPVWDRGCAHAVARSFLDLVEESQDLKTTDLCMNYLKPMTAKAKCSVWEALAMGFSTYSKKTARDLVEKIGELMPMAHLSMQHYIGKPDTFVSHCWASSYNELLVIMQRYDENTNRNNFFFLDVFSMNQHDFADISGTQMEELAEADMSGSPRSISSSISLVGLKDIYQTMLQALTRSIATPGRVLLALTPHQQPLLLTRSWCLYEIYIAWKVGAEVSCGFVPAAEQSVTQSLMKSDELINEMLAAVDAEKSRATMETDRKMILSLIKQAGVQRFNTFVREKLSASLRVVALTTVSRQISHQDVWESEGLFTSSNSFEVEADVPVPPHSISLKTCATRSDFVHKDHLRHLQDLDSEDEFAI